MQSEALFGSFLTFFILKRLIVHPDVNFPEIKFMKAKNQQNKNQHARLPAWYMLTYLKQVPCHSK